MNKVRRLPWNLKFSKCQENSGFGFPDLDLKLWNLFEKCGQTVQVHPFKFKWERLVGILWLVKLSKDVESNNLMWKDIQTREFILTTQLNLSQDMQL